MDRHDFCGQTALDAAEMHRKDIEAQGRHGVEYLTYWFDHDRQTAFCLAPVASFEVIWQPA